ncbi:hypothetical protein ACNFBR_26585 [Pseudomonas sp. NY11955]|uniref:hypothetical protein n=1 Tax=Pseudomonas sp. NY11955 TaxID=3400363 RepID=UPI003A8AFFA3
MPTQLQDGQLLVYQTDADGLYVGTTAADPDPQNIGQWLMPAGCVDVKPPAITGGKRPQWVGYKWKLISL